MAFKTRVAGLLKIFKNFAQSIAGNIALTASILAMPLFAAGGVAIDYAYLYKLESALQNAADSSALATAKELSLANADTDALISVASDYVFSNLGVAATEKDTKVISEPAADRTEITISARVLPMN